MMGAWSKASTAVSRWLSGSARRACYPYPRNTNQYHSYRRMRMVFFCSRGGPGIHTDIVTRHIRNGVQRRKNGKENQGK